MRRTAPCGFLPHRGRGILGPPAALYVGVSAILRDSPEYAHQFFLCHARCRRLCKCQQKLASRLRDWALCEGTRLVAEVAQRRAKNPILKRIEADVDLRTCKYKAWRWSLKSFSRRPWTLVTQAPAVALILSFDSALLAASLSFLSYISSQQPVGSVYRCPTTHMHNKGEQFSPSN